jgi:integrase/recombinase XerC
MADWSKITPAKLLEAHVRRPGHTGRAYAGDLWVFAKFLQVESDEEAVRVVVEQPLGVVKLTLQSYVNWLRQRYALNTVRRRIQCIRSLLRLAYEAEISTVMVPSYPMPAAESVRNTRGPDRIEIDAMLTACEKRGDGKGLRDAAMLRLMASCALRANELLLLDVKHIDIDAREMMVLSKGVWGTRPSRFPFTLKTGAAISSWIEARGDADGPLFTTLDRAVPDRASRLTYWGLYSTVRQIGSVAGIERVHPHGLRHYATTEFLRLTGGNVAWAMALTRHKDPRTLIVYNDERLTHAREAMEIIDRGVPVFNQNRHDSDNI